MISPEISLKEALYAHILQLPKLEGITENELFQDDRPIDMVDLKNKDRKINIVFEKVSEGIGTVDNASEIFNIILFGVYDNPETDSKMEMLKNILIKEFNGNWGYLAMNMFRIDGANFLGADENVNYETREREIALRFEFFYQRKIASGMNLAMGM